MKDRSLQIVENDFSAEDFRMNFGHGRCTT